MQALCLIANLNAFILDYSARQKVGGTHLADFVTRQLPVLPAASLAEGTRLMNIDAQEEWIALHAFELVYTAHDLRPLAHDCGYNGPPFPWDEARRFEIRCELDAAFFHLYLPCELDGGWRRAEGETPEQLAALRHHFLQPRDAVAYILDQFPIV
jgi:hypothetical protein